MKELQDLWLSVLVPKISNKMKLIKLSYTFIRCFDKFVLLVLKLIAADMAVNSPMTMQHTDTLLHCWFG